MNDLPTVRWGIVATGNISTQFVTDILMHDWPEKKANHTVTAIGSSSIEKCRKFAASVITPANPVNPPALYGSYQEVYNDQTVDCVYIGTPHSLHKKICLDAIAAGKNVLCEKPFTLNVREAEEVFAAAKAKGVFVMEAVWTRFFPAMRSLQKFLHEDQRLGKIYRMFCDFGLDMDLESLPEDKYYRNPALGGGSLLDIGLYSLTWGLTTLCADVGDAAEDPEVSSTQTLAHDVDVASSVILHFQSTGCQAICTSTLNSPEPQHGQKTFARIEGNKGSVVVSGLTPSSPQKYTFYPKGGGEREVFEFEKPGMGFWWEADAVALDLQAGRTQNEVMPWSETLRVLRIMDGVRMRWGARFPVDDW